MQYCCCFFFFQAEDGIRDADVTGVQTCALPILGAVQITDSHEVLLISDGGTLVRTRATEIAQVGRNTQGVTLMRLGEGETLQAIERIDTSIEDNGNGDEEAGPDADTSAPASDAGGAAGEQPTA